MTTTDTIDLEEELPRRERRRLVTPVGVVAVAVAIAALGFFGGVQVQKSRGGTARRRRARPPGGFAGARGRLRRRGRAARPARRGAGDGGGRRRGRGRRRAARARQAGATVGQVSSVDGKTLYVDDASGNTVKVRLAKGGTVTRTAKAAATRDPPRRHGDRPGRDRLQRHGRGELDPRDREQRADAGASARFRRRAHRGPQGAPGGGG